jgi:hypothetical protein
MFTHVKFEVDIVQRLDGSELRWPEPGEATEDSGLGCNRLYADLRRLSWSEAKRVFALEGELIARIEASEDSNAECEAVEEELSEGEADLLGLDLGVASTVACLSAARCVPFTSCNAGALGGQHQEVYPLVAFFSRPQMVDILLACATEAEIGLENHDYGCVVAYADDVRKLRRFAETLINKRSALRAIRIRQRARATITPGPEPGPTQYKLPLE